MNTDSSSKAPEEDCSVAEEIFPRPGKCCRKGGPAYMVSYEKICPYCDISASLPYGAGLKTAIIFECSRFGYGKRVTE